MINIVGFLILVFLPGAWITFGRPFSSLPFWARFLGGSVLTPLVLCLQFYALRLFGLPFELTPVFLVVVNLPALFLIYKHRKDIRVPDRRTLAGWALVLLVPFLLMARQIIDTQDRIYTGHAWAYSDPIYMIANGDLLLEDPELVGVRLDYPWAGLVYEGILSYVLDSPPAASYIWINMLWLLFICAFSAGIVGELGGNRFSRITSVIWLFFGVNFVGYWLEQLLWSVLGKWYPITGDYRYTPWLLKFLFFEQEPLTLGVFIAIVFLIVRQRPENLTREQLVLIFVLLLELAIIYPLYFPAAAAVIGAKAMAMLMDRHGARLSNLFQEIAPLLIIVFAAGVASFLNVKLLTQDRVTPTWYFAPSWKWKTISTVVVTSLLLVGLCLAFRRCWKERRSATIVLVLSAIASCILAIPFDIPGFGNEYKFIFTAAICLAPFASLTFESVMPRLGNRALPVFAIITLVLAFPLASKMYWDFPWIQVDQLSVKPPAVDLSGFDLRLAPTEKFSGLCDAIRTNTPTNTILVLENAELHFPTLTRRMLFVPPDQAQDKRHPGVNIISDDILQISRGYDKQIFTDRRLILEALFDSNDAVRRTESLNQILKLGRPIGIILEKERNASLLAWLSTERKGMLLYEGNGFVVWFIKPDSVGVDGRVKPSQQIELSITETNHAERIS